MHGVGFAVEPAWLGTLPANQRRVNVSLRRAPLPVAPAWRRAGWYLGGTWRDAVVYWRKTGPFRLVAGREIHLCPPTAAEPARLADTLLGELGGMVLLQRGAGVFHASAAAMAGTARVFLGEAGAGKSTLAAALVRQGAELLADDVLRLDLRRGRVLAVPGSPRLKLAPANCRAVGLDPAALPAVYRGARKRVWLPAPAHVATRARPVAAIYALAEGRTWALARLPAAAALLTVAQQSFAGYVQRGFGFDFLGTPARRAAHFRRVARLAAAVPVYRLTRPAGAPLDLERLLRLVLG